jgi:hypothetical protein
MYLYNVVYISVVQLEIGDHMQGETTCNQACGIIYSFVTSYCKVLYFLHSERYERNE